MPGTVVGDVLTGAPVAAGADDTTGDADGTTAEAEGMTAEPDGGAPTCTQAAASSAIRGMNRLRRIGSISIRGVRLIQN